MSKSIIEKIEEALESRISVYDLSFKFLYSDDEQFDEESTYSFNVMITYLETEEENKQDTRIFQSLCVESNHVLTHWDNIKNDFRLIINEFTEADDISNEDKDLMTRHFVRECEKLMDEKNIEFFNL